MTRTARFTRALDSPKSDATMSAPILVTFQPPASLRATKPSFSRSARTFSCDYEMAMPRYLQYPG